MSLIPYQPHEGREVVLRHRNAIVVRDPTSHRLELRGVTECPMCHQPLSGVSTVDQPFDRDFARSHDSYVDPEYFRMLSVGEREASSSPAPSSPIRRVLQPALGSSEHPRCRSVSPEIVDGGGAEFASGAPAPGHADGSRIRKNAFSPNYFHTFFVEEKVLGRGGKGVVLLVRHEIDGCFLGHFACKRVPVGDNHAWLEKVLIEVELLAKLSHPNLVSYRHVWLEDVQLNRFGPIVACAFILQQYCNSGDLHHYITGGAPREATKEDLKAQMRRRSRGQAENTRLLSTKPYLPFEEIYSLFRDVTSGVAYLHGAGYIHRDLKPSNCLLHRDGGRLVCLISDFGEVQPEHVIRKSSGSTGTISYCAPEVLKLDSTGHYANFTTKSDIFSLGMILYFLCFGRLPYQSANVIQEELEDVDQLRAEIADWKGFQGERRERPDLPSKLYKLLQKLLSLNPADRPSATEVLNAMRSEGSFDGLTNGARSTSPPVKSRIQNLDSPVTPGTPVSGFRSQRNTNRISAPTLADNAIDDDGSSPQVESLLQRRSRSENTHEQHAESMTVTHGSSGNRPTSLPKPSQGFPEQQPDDVFSPPLLMAPPRRGLDAARHNFALAAHRSFGVLGLHVDLLSYSVRLFLFFVKLVTLLRPCWPYMASFPVCIPLIMVAALDLGRQRSNSQAQRWGGMENRAFLLSTHISTITLLLLHFTVLWIATRWEALCVAPTWTHWGDW